MTKKRSCFVAHLESEGNGYRIMAKARVDRKKYGASGIPESMLAVRQHGPGGKPIIEEIPVPVPGPGQVLVRMAASPVNPSDLALLRGGYLSRPYPFTPGLEGSGMVVRSGGGVLPWLRTGKRVACSPDPGENGTWAEYMRTSAMRVFPLHPRVSLEKGSMMLVNPLTALAFIHLAREGNHRAIVNNAAAGALGKMLMRLTAAAGLPLINIVRRESQIEELEKAGAKIVLNSSDPGFEEHLQELISELDATFILDAVGGVCASRLLRLANDGSILVEYARLSGEELHIDPSELITRNKRITGFQLGNWLNSKSTLFKIRLMYRVKHLLPGTLESEIRCRMPLEQVEEAIRLYRENMSAGKIILKPGIVHEELHDQ